MQYLEGVREFRVMVLGEAILDEYVYCDALGKSGKEAMLAMKYISQERYAGGTLAVANHLAEFCKHVTLVSYLGMNSPQEEFIRAQLRPEVMPRFIYKSNSPVFRPIYPR
jgi:bifunctional ADP-heptose synthase (sugar kinase/adenylyltransferase)